MKAVVLRLMVLVLVMVGSAVAHDIQQIFVRVTLEEDRWEGVVDLDGLMLLEYAQGGVVLEDGSNGWFADLDEAQALALFEFAELFWRDRFGIALDGRECPFEVSLPDPLLLQKDVAGSPEEPLTVVLRMEGRYAAGGGTLRVSWKDTEAPTPESIEPNLAVGVLVPGSNLGTTVLPVEEGEVVEIGEREGCDRGRGAGPGGSGDPGGPGVLAEIRVREHPAEGTRPPPLHPGARSCWCRDGSRCWRSVRRSPRRIPSRWRWWCSGCWRHRRRWSSR